MGKLYARDVSKENAVGMESALGLPGRAGGVDDEGGILVRGVNRGEIRGGPFERCPEVRVGAVFAVHDEDVPKLREGGSDRVDLWQIFSVGDEGSCRTMLQPMFERLRSELREQRQGHRAHLVDGDVGKKRFRTLRQQNADTIAALDPMRGQHVGEAIGQGLQLVERERSHVSGPAFIYQRGPALTRGPVVTHRYPDVKLGRDLPNKPAADLGIATWCPHLSPNTLEIDGVPATGWIYFNAAVRGRGCGRSPALLRRSVRRSMARTHCR
jgi:hypothetical protein